VSLRTRIDEIDGQMDQIKRLIDNGAVLDAAMGAGLGCTKSMSALQSDIDGAVVSVETMDRHVRMISK
jgi:hypothetical protein